MAWQDDFKREVYEKFRENLFKYKLEEFLEQDVEKQKNFIFGFVYRCGLDEETKEIVTKLLDDEAIIDPNKDAVTNLFSFHRALEKLPERNDMYIRRLMKKMEDDLKVVEKTGRQRHIRSCGNHLREFNYGVARLRLYLKDQRDKVDDTQYRNLVDRMSMVSFQADSAENLKNFWRDLDKEALRKKAPELVIDIDDKLKNLRTYPQWQKETYKKEHQNDLDWLDSYLNEAVASHEAKSILREIVEANSNKEDSSEKNYQRIKDALYQKLNDSDMDDDLCQELRELAQGVAAEKTRVDQVAQEVEEAMKAARENKAEDVTEEEREYYERLSREIFGETAENNFSESENASPTTEDVEKDVATEAETVEESHSSEERPASEEASSQSEASVRDVSPAPEVTPSSETSPAPETASPAVSTAPSVYPEQPIVTSAPVASMQPVVPQAMAPSMPATMAQPSQKPMTAADLANQQRLAAEAARLKEEEEERRKMENANFLVKAGDWLQRNIFDRIGDAIPVLGKVIKMVGNILTGLLKTIGHVFDGNWGDAGKTGVSWLQDTAIIGGAAASAYALGRQFGWWGKKTNSDANKNMAIIGAGASVVGSLTSALTSTRSTSASTSSVVPTSVSPATSALVMSAAPAAPASAVSAVGATAGLRGRLGQPALASSTQEENVVYSQSSQHTIG